MQKIDICVIIEAKNSNPNGDPDTGNLPRQNAISGVGLITDACIKRKIRAQMELAGLNIYVSRDAVLKAKKDAILKDLGAAPIDDDEGDGAEEEVLEEKSKKKGKKAAKLSPEVMQRFRDEMCARFADVRFFGATTLTGEPIRGPIQISLSESVEPINIINTTITRCAAEKESERNADNKTMGQRSYVDHALYKVAIHIDPHAAAKTGFNDADLDFLLTALVRLFDGDASSGRAGMDVKAIHVFRHDNELTKGTKYVSGVQLVQNGIRVARRAGVDTPRSYDDYQVSVIPQDKLPAGVTIETMEVNKLADW